MKKQSSSFNFKNCLIGSFTGFINGVFGSGGGTLLVPILNNILKVEEHKSHSTALAIIIFLSTTSSIIYISKGTLDINLTIQAGKFLRIGFGIVMIIAAFRMVF